MRRLCFRRGLSAAVLLTMTLSLALPASAADPLASGGFAEVLISAQDTDVPQTTLQLSLYERNKDGRFQAVDTLDFDTPVNRVTKDAEFHLIPQTAQVTLTVDYLTDLNGDGLYELLLSSQEGIIIRLHANEIPLQSRYGSGVRVMRLGENDKVMVLARTDHDDEAQTEQFHCLE